ncbi:MAG: tetratricopeptide repeat protein [Bacteroidia bacterium]|nr:tetratricopeptide repeat protein [Bacteroidia bacterium]
MKTSALNDTDRVKILVRFGYELKDSLKEDALVYCQEAYELAEKINYKRGIASSLEGKGNILDILKKYDEAIESFMKANEIRKKLGEKINQGKNLNNIGTFLEYQGKYNIALEHFLSALRIYEEAGYTTGQGIVLNNIGIIYIIQKNYDKAIEYQKKSLIIKEEQQDTAGMASSIDNIGIAYLYKEDLDQALIYAKKSMGMREKLNDQLGLSRTLNNVGNIYSKQKNYSTALDFFIRALKIKNELNDHPGAVVSLNNIGELYAAQGKYDKAISYFTNCLEKAREIHFKEAILSCYTNLAQAHRAKTNFEIAFDFHERFTSLKDSLFNEQSTKSMNEMQAKYESDKKEKEIEMLTKNNVLQALITQQQKDQIKKQKLLILGIFFILGLAVSLIYVVYSQFKFKRNANIELESKNDLLEITNKDLDKKNRSISESINYAQRIQETIMPTQSHLKQIFPDSFIFYKAKDVVSGDFPWTMNTNENFFAAAVDCTGHGVPGAMMSMIGYFLLNDIVGGKNVHDPAEILNLLHNGIKDTLKQEENLESTDGMDIAICKINKEKMEVEFAGAHRPLIWMHNGEIREIKGDRFPVGGLQYSSRGKEINFISHKLNLEIGDSIYFYSDGLIDQIGGQNGKRFRNDQVKEIILTHQDKSMEELNEIFDQKFTKWMDGCKQLDDVIMIGIRI